MCGIKVISAAGGSKTVRESAQTEVKTQSRVDNLKLQELEMKVEILSKIFEEAQEALLKENKLLRQALVSTG